VETVVGKHSLINTSSEPRCHCAAAHAANDLADVSRRQCSDPPSNAPPSATTIGVLAPVRSARSPHCCWPTFLRCTTQTIARDGIRFATAYAESFRATEDSSRSRRDDARAHTRTTILITGFQHPPRVDDLGTQLPCG